jgi:hypothetical protein
MPAQNKDKTYECPSCGELVDVGAVICNHCGTNLKSGETFESRVRRQKSKARHPEQFADTLLVGGAFVVGLILLTSFIVQNRAVGILKADPPGLRPVVLGIELVEQLTEIAHDPALSEEQKAVQSRNLVTVTRRDVYSALYTEEIAPGDELEMDTDPSRPAQYASDLATALIRAIELREKQLKEFEAGSTESSVKRRDRIYGDDFSLGTYRRLLGALKKRLELKLDALEGTGAA